MGQNSSGPHGMTTQLINLPAETFDHVVWYFSPSDLVGAARVCHEWFFYFDPLIPVHDNSSRLIAAASVGNFALVHREIAKTKYSAQILAQVLELAVRPRGLTKVAKVTKIIDPIVKRLPSVECWSRAAAALITAQDWETIAEVLDNDKKSFTYTIFLIEAIKLGNIDFIYKLPENITRPHPVKNALFSGRFDINFVHDTNQYLSTLKAIFIARRYDREKITDLLNATIQATFYARGDSDTAIDEIISLLEAIFASPCLMPFLKLFASEPYLSKFGKWVSDMILIACRSHHAEATKFIRDHVGPKSFSQITLANWLLKSSNFSQDYRFLIDNGINFNRQQFIQHAQYYHKQGEIPLMVAEASDPDERLQCLHVAIRNSDFETLRNTWLANPDLAAKIWIYIVGDPHLDHCRHALAAGIPQPLVLEQWAERVCIMNTDVAKRRAHHQVLNMIREHRAQSEKMDEEKI
jgi:hypothetical protein